MLLTRELVSSHDYRPFADPVWVIQKINGYWGGGQFVSFYARLLNGYIGCCVCDGAGNALLYYSFDDAVVAARVALNEYDSGCESYLDGFADNDDDDTQPITIRVAGDWLVDDGADALPIDALSDPEDVCAELQANGVSEASLNQIVREEHIPLDVCVTALLGNYPNAEDGYLYNAARDVLEEWFYTKNTTNFIRVHELADMLGAALGSAANAENWIVGDIKIGKGSQRVTFVRRPEGVVMRYQQFGQALAWLTVGKTARECYRILHSATRRIARKNGTVHGDRALETEYVFHPAGNSALRVEERKVKYNG